MYIDAYRAKDTIIVWERTEHGRDIKLYDAPYYFYTPDPDGEYTSIYDDKLKKHTFRSRNEFLEGKKVLKAKGVELFESDIDPEVRILSEMYYGKERPPLHTSYLDIEVDYDPRRGFASPEDPYAIINSIAVYNDWENRMILHAIPPDITWYNMSTEEIFELMAEKEPLPTDVELELTLHADEKGLLVSFLKDVDDADVFSGWNSRLFDLPYIAARLELMGRKFLKMLTIEHAPMPRWVDQEIMGRTAKTIELVGRVSLDYLEIFKKFEVTERPSFKLESIAEELLPDMRKLDPGMPLSELYKKDFAGFIRYNLRDTEVLKGFEEVRGYVDLSNLLVHISSAQFKNLMGTLKLAEYSTIDYIHHVLKLIVNDNRKTEDEVDQIQGAFVLEPKVGLHDWIGSVDLNSLYPSSIRAINISPETLIGQFEEFEHATRGIASANEAEYVLKYEDGRRESKTGNDWRIFLLSKKWAVSGYGTVFDQNQQGIVPTVLENWYSTRKEYQKQKAIAKDAGDKLKATYYDKLQYVTKIRLNAFYGALTNQYFRFFDLRMGESTTATGRFILMHQTAKINEILTGDYNAKGKSVLYGDTDSTYFSTFCEDKRSAVMVADRIAAIVNESFPPFMRKTFLCNDGFCDIIQAAREAVAGRGIFVSKKMYMLHIVDDEGYDADKLKVMGLATKRTTLPREISSYINDTLKDFLKGSDWDSVAVRIADLKTRLEETKNIFDLGLPTGVKKVESYTEAYENWEKKRIPVKNIPGHVAASIFYNQCLKDYNDNHSPKIVSGSKIRVFYLSRQYGRFKSIALPSDLEEIPKWFTDNYTVDRNKQIERLVNKTVLNIFEAIGKEIPSRQTLFVEDILEF